MVAPRDGRMKSPLSVTKWGTGQAKFVGLHGWGGSHRTFVPMINYLPDGVIVEAPDLPGCGQSSLPDQWRVETIAEMVSDSITFESGFTIAYVPGLLFVEHGNDTETQFAQHIELCYEFELKQFHLGPQFDIGIEKDGFHYSFGIHLGVDF